MSSIWRGRTYVCMFYSLAEPLISSGRWSKAVFRKRILLFNNLGCRYLAPDDLHFNFIYAWPLIWSFSQGNIILIMTSSSGNVFCVTGPLCGEFTDSPHKGQWREALMFSSICAWTNDWANNQDAGDLRRHRIHYDVTVMANAIFIALIQSWTKHLSLKPGFCYSNPITNVLNYLKREVSISLKWRPYIIAEMLQVPGWMMYWHCEFCIYIGMVAKHHFFFQK